MLGEMFEGDFAEMCTENFFMLMGRTSRPVKRVQTGSEDPHQHEQIFFLQFFLKSMKSCPVPCVYHLLSHQNYAAKTFWCINSKRRVGLIPSFIFRCSVNLKRVCSQ